MIFKLSFIKIFGIIMDRRTFLKTSAAMASVSALNISQAKAAESEKPKPAYTAKYGENPNVVFILSDQHNAKVMGHQGHRMSKLPILTKWPNKEHGSMPASQPIQSVRPAESHLFPASIAITMATTA